MHSCSAMDRHMQHAVFHTFAFLAFSCLAFSASPLSLLRRLSTWRYPHLLLSAGTSVARLPQRDRSYRSTSAAHRALSSKPVGRRCRCRSMGQTDGRPLHRACSAYTQAVFVTSAYPVMYPQCQDVTQGVSVVYAPPVWKALHGAQQYHCAFCSLPIPKPWTLKTACGVSPKAAIHVYGIVPHWIRKKEWYKL